MRVVVMFDLAMTTKSDLKKYRNFRKFLIEDGFLMLQESVYIKLALNQTAANFVKSRVRKNCPDSGNVIVFWLTEKQFSDLEIIGIEKKSTTLESTERLVIL